MKTKIVAISISAVLWGNLLISQSSPDIEKLCQNKSILYRLTLWKSAVEQTAVENYEASTTSASDKKKIFDNYCRLQSTLDALLTTFEFKMNNNNFLANKFNKLDKEYVADTALVTDPPPHIKNQTIIVLNTDIELYFNACKDFVNSQGKTINPVVKGGLAIDPLELINDIAGIVQFALTYQGTRATNLNSLIDKVRLSAPKDIFSN